MWSLLFWDQIQIDSHQLGFLIANYIYQEVKEPEKRKLCREALFKISSGQLSSEESIKLLQNANIPIVSNGKFSLGEGNKEKIMKSFQKLYEIEQENNFKDIILFWEFSTCRLIKTSPDISQGLFLLTGNFLSSQAVSSQVLSTSMCLTTVFGMGTGGTT